MHVVRIVMCRRSVYFLNIYIIRVYYRCNRNRALQLGLVYLRKFDGIATVPHTPSHSAFQNNQNHIENQQKYTK